MASHEFKQAMEITNPSNHRQKNHHVHEVDQIHLLRDLHWDLFWKLEPFLKTRIRLRKVDPHVILDAIIDGISQEWWDAVTADALSAAAAMFQAIDHQPNSCCCNPKECDWWNECQGKSPCCGNANPCPFETFPMEGDEEQFAKHKGAGG